MHTKIQKVEFPSERLLITSSSHNHHNLYEKRKEGLLKEIKLNLGRRVHRILVFSDLHV